MFSFHRVFPSPGFAIPGVGALNKLLAAAVLSAGVAVSCPERRQGRRRDRRRDF
jgi:hypothetical protein